MVRDEQGPYWVQKEVDLQPSTLDQTVLLNPHTLNSDQTSAGFGGKRLVEG